MNARLNTEALDNAAFPELPRRAKPLPTRGNMRAPTTRRRGTFRWAEVDGEWKLKAARNRQHLGRLARIDGVWHGFIGFREEPFCAGSLRDCSARLTEYWLRKGY